MTAQALPDNAVLENAIWASMTGAHAHLTEGTDRARRYLPTIAPFVGINDIDDPRTWTELAQLVGPGQEVAVPRDVDNRSHRARTPSTVPFQRPTVPLSSPTVPKSTLA